MSSENNKRIFTEKYPNVSSHFETIIVEHLNAQELSLFYDAMAYSITLTAQTYDDKKFYDHLMAVNSMNLGQRHPFLKFVYVYQLMNIMGPPCLSELDSALDPKCSIEFEDRKGTIESLHKDFWGRYLELEVAYNLIQCRCGVKLLHRERSKTKYPDLEVRLKGEIYNIEVSNRRYEIFIENAESILKDKIIEEAEQLVNTKNNIIILVLTDSLPDVQLNRKVNVLRRVNMFSFNNVVFDRSSMVSIVKNGRQRMVNNLIMDTDERLKHVDCIGGWFHGQSPLFAGASPSRWFQFFGTTKFSHDMNEVFSNINSRFIQIA